MRIGAKLPDFGPDIHEIPLGEAARLAEDAGFDSVWVTDHVVMVRDAASPYPFSPDGVITWDPAEPRYRRNRRIGQRGGSHPEGRGWRRSAHRSPAQSSRPGQATRFGGRAQRRPIVDRRRGGLAGRGVHRTRRAIRDSREAPRRVDRHTPGLLDRHPSWPHLRPLPNSRRRSVLSDSGPPDPDPDWRNVEPGIAESRSAGRWVARIPTSRQHRPRRLAGRQTTDDGGSGRGRQASGTYRGATDGSAGVGRPPRWATRIRRSHRHYRRGRLAFRRRTETHR